MVQKILQCCSKTPAYLVTYSVSGSDKDYLVCLTCIAKECFSKYIIRRLSVEKQKIFFQNEPSELFDESIVVSELDGEQILQNEHNNEHGGFIL